MKLFRSSTTVAALAVSALFLSVMAPSCAWVGAATRGGKLNTIVTVPASQPGAFDAQVVEASVNRYSEAGVRALESQEWAKAVTAFENALLTMPSDAATHFGLAIALEMSGDITRAADHYARAMKFAGAPNPEYKLGLERANAKLGR